MRWLTGDQSWRPDAATLPTVRRRSRRSGAHSSRAARSGHGYGASCRLESSRSGARPTFATVVEPLEELQHRVSKTWSPVSHLMRCSIQMHCAPDITPVCRCYPRIKPTSLRVSHCIAPTKRLPSRKRRPGTRATAADRSCAARFPPGRCWVGAAAQGALQDVMLELTQLQAKFEENVLDATNG